MKFVGCMTILGVVGGLASAAWAEDDAPKPGQLTMLRDKAGHLFFIDDAAYRASVLEDREPKHGAPSLYFGNERVVHRYSANDKFRRSAPGRPPMLDLLFWDAVNDVSALRLVQDQSWTLHCDDKQREFEVVPQAAAAKVAAKLKVVPRPAFTKQPYLLARDDDAYYYYVERDSARASDFSLFIGSRGSMKKQRIVRSAKDSAGILLVTKEGRLKGARRPGTAFHDVEWLPHKGEPKKLVRLDPQFADRDFLYGELGVYLATRFQTPCETVFR